MRRKAVLLDRWILEDHMNVQTVPMEGEEK